MTKLRVKSFKRFKRTLPKTNMDTQNDCLEKVTPIKNGNFWYLPVRFLGCMTLYDIQLS